MFNEEYARYLNLFNDELERTFDGLEDGAPNEIKDAMRYAVTGGGKRIRPILLLATADILGVKLDKVLPFAVSLECVHSYSLVHDDLPAMDNDDYRRGKLSTHKKFGEATGILCGDALLNFAYENALSVVKNENDAKALKILADYAGYGGMIKGQVLDLYYEGKEANGDALFEIYYNKTAKLLTAPLLIASTLAGGKYFDELKSFGENLGLLFQITDDLLDETGTLEKIGKSPKKDKMEDKLTSIKIFGLNGAKNIAEEYYEKAVVSIEKIPNSDFLLNLAKLTLYRDK